MKSEQTEKTVLNEAISCQFFTMWKAPAPYIFCTSVLLTLRIINATKASGLCIRMRSKTAERCTASEPLGRENVVKGVNSSIVDAFMTHFNLI